MKNFRKVLALILVVATLFSFVAMASAKTTADYSDGDKVKYVEAVDVLSAVGILKGYDGAYHPELTIDRDEMAKMIAVLRNGAEDDADLFKGANTFADVKGSWAEGYIAYAAQVGIINGRNATTFDPEGKVTGTEIMKMLLCVLGYDAKAQGYVGSNWQVNVMRDAKKMDLMAGMENFDAYAAATRDEAAQLMYNALKANLVVGYVSENIVKITNSLYVSEDKNGKLSFDITTPDAKKAGFEVTYCNAVISGTPLFSIIKGLEISENVSFDCYGRPGHVWTYKVNKKVAFEKLYLDTPFYTQTKGDFDAVKTAAKDHDEDLSWVVMRNGKLVKDGFKNGFDAGNGVLVELYDMGDGKGRIVVVDTFIAKVAKVSEYYNYFILEDEGKNQLHKVALDDYEVETGDMVLYWVCNGSTEDASAPHVHNVEVVEATPVDVAEGFHSFKDINDAYIVADGDDYYYAALLGDNYVANLNPLKWADIDRDGSEWDLYLDQYGYIKWLTPTTTETEYKYTYLVEGTLDVHDHGFTVGSNGETIYNKDYDINMVDYGTDGVLSVTEDVVTNDATQMIMINAGVANGTGVLAKVHTNDDGETVVDAQASFAKAGTELSKDSFELNNNLYATSKTVFMIRTMNLDGSYTYEQVTGYKNLKGNYVAKALKNDMTSIQYFLNADHSDKDAKEGFVDYVFIDAKYTRDFAAKFLTLGEAKYSAFKTDLKKLFPSDYTAYNALVGGEEALVLVDDELKDTDDKDIVLEAAKMYKGELSYINVAITVDGKELPIYKVVDDKFTAIDNWVDCYYVVTEDETFIRNKDGKVYKLADDAVVMTITANKDEDGNWVADYYEGYLPTEDEDMNKSNVSCYVEFNGDGEVSTLYVLDQAWVDMFKPEA